MKSIEIKGTVRTDVGKKHPHLAPVLQKQRFHPVVVRSIVGEQ